MELKQLKLFKAIADAGSMRAAAESTYTAQPNLSYQMKLLEQELGVTLLERKHTGVALTPAGKLLYERAETLLNFSEAAKQEVRHAGQKRVLRIGITPTVTPLSVPILHQFSNLHPDVNFDVHDGLTFQLLDLLKNRVVDIAMIRTPANLEGLQILPIRQEPMVAASLFDAEGQGKPLPLKDLEHKRLILYRRYYDLYMDAFRKIQMDPNVICWCDDARTAKNWAQEGFGTAIYPESMCQKNDGLLCRKILCADLNTTILLAWEKKRDLPEIVRNFLAFYKKDPDIVNCQDF